MGVFLLPTHEHARRACFLLPLSQSKPVASKKERPNLPVFGMLVYVPPCASMGIARRGL